MHALRHGVHTAFKTSVEALMPVRKDSAFKEKGVLSPEEFVAAGDRLTRACPTWTWKAGDAKSAKPYLPRDKQYLVTRNVPCAKRAKEMEAYAGKEEVLTGEDEGWVAAGARAGSNGSRRGESGVNEEELPEIVDLSLQTREEEEEEEEGEAQKEGGNDADVPDMDDEFDDEDDDAVILPTATAIAKQAGSANGGVEDEHIVKTRTYDISITYDKYYQTPRVWLNGYDENRLVLKPSKSLEDISADHAQKTVTIDPHPHTGVPSASIHPCKHGNVMKKLIDLADAESGASLTVDSYLFVFLKFIASVIPTVEYDYTL
jgi:ubiquitin-like-conjugating enzyme ATG3